MFIYPLNLTRHVVITALRNSVAYMYAFLVFTNLILCYSVEPKCGTKPLLLYKLGLLTFKSE